MEPLFALVADGVAGIDAFLVDAVTSPWMLAVLFAACLIDGILPPVPSELLLMTAAVLTWTTTPEAIVVVTAAAAAGAWAGDNAAYAIGRWSALSRLPWMRRSSSVHALQSVEREFRKRPESILLTGRFLPIARVLVNATAGAVRLPYPRFLLLSLLSAVIWAGTSVSIAVLVGMFVTRDPLPASIIAIGIALTAGLAIDRVLVWRRGVTTRGRNA